MIRYYEYEDIEDIAKLIDDNWKSAYRGIIDDEFLDQKDKKRNMKKRNLLYISRMKKYLVFAD